MNRPDTHQLVSFLRRQHVKSSYMNRLKVAYRPYICPFDDLLKMISDDDTVFDVGCGSGQFATLLAEFTKVRKIGGVEISEELVRNARQLLSPYSDKVSYKFEVYDGVTIPNLDDYSVIVFIDVLHHIPRQRQQSFIRTIYDRMRKGARLIIKDIEAASPLVHFNRLHDRIFAGEVGHEMRSVDLKNQLSKMGFHVSTHSRKNLYVYPHYTILATK